MKKVYVSRVKMASELANDDYEDIDSDSIYGMILDGCLGYSQYSDEELQATYNGRYDDMENEIYTCKKPKVDWDE